MILKQLTRYVAKHILYSSFIVAVALMSIFIIFTYIAKSSDIGKGDFDTLSVFIYVLMIAPSNLYLIMPMVALFGCLMSLSTLAHNSEITVMRAAGMSIFDISKGIVVAGIFLSTISFILGAFVSPYMSFKADIYENNLKNNSIKVAEVNNEVWLKTNKGFVKAVYQNTLGKLNNIERFDIHNNKLNNIYYAKSAIYNNSEWSVNDIDNIEIKKDKVDFKNYNTEIWQQLMPSNLIGILNTETNYLNIFELGKIVFYSNDSKSENSNSLKLKFWQTIFQPMSLFILMLIALPFSFGSTRSGGVAAKLIIGLILGFIFFLINQFFGPLTMVYQLNPILGAVLPTLLFFMFLVFLFWKMRE